MQGDEVAATQSEKISPWNSLEKTKVIVGAATPLAIAFLGIVVSLANAKEAKLSRTLDRRLEIWDRVGPKIRQMKDQAALIYMNSVPNLPPAQRSSTIGSIGVLELAQSTDETLEVQPFFSPSVMQYYIDFSNCAIELAQMTEFNARTGVQPIPRERLNRLWEATDRGYGILINQVRIELSTAAPFNPDEVYPRREARPSDRDTSACLGIRT